MLATTSMTIAEAYAPKRMPLDQVGIDGALHEFQVDRQKALIQDCLRRGGVVETREGKFFGPFEALVASATGEAGMHLRVAMALANNGHDEAALKSLRSAVEAIVLRIADGNATALDLGERVPLEFIPDRPARVPSAGVAQ